MRSRRLLTLFPLLVGIVAGIWALTSRTGSAPSLCLPSDPACLADAVSDAAPKGFLEQVKVLSSAVAAEPSSPPAVCAAAGFALGASSGAPFADVSLLLSPRAGDLECRSAVLSGLLENWSARVETASTGQLREDVGSLVRMCVDSTDVLCGDAVATGASLALSNDDALHACYRLSGDVRATCLGILLQRFTDRSQDEPGRTTDPREDLVVLCAYWPVDGAAEDDCAKAAGPAIFSSAFGSLRLSAASDTSALREAVGFCLRLGSGATACQDAVFRGPPSSGMVGAARSDRRTAYCSVFDETLRDECMTITAATSDVTSPG